MSVPSSPYVAVVGPSDADAELCALAAQAGRLIAARGGIVVCGGLGGVMDAVARGASEAGGASLGILPGRDRLEASEHLTLSLASGLGELRNGLVVRCSDGVLAVGGSWGTLSEVALARRIGLPVVALRGWSVIREDGLPAGGVLLAHSAEEAVAELFVRLEG